jgi:predicted nucleic acid-binding protein
VPSAPKTSIIKPDSWIGEALSAIRVLCPSPVPLTIETHDAALRIAAQYPFHIYDALNCGCGTRC